MASKDCPLDNIDGRWVQPRIIRGHESLTGTHQGSVYVEAAGSLELLGTHQGSLHLDPDSRAVIVGSHQGSLSVAPHAHVTVRGQQQGSVHVSSGGEIIVEPRGKLAGSLHIEGTVRNGDTRGGTASGDGVLEDLPGSSVKQPVMRNGMSVYEW